MNEEFSETFEKIIRLEKELEREFKKKNRQIIRNYQERKIRFEESIRRQQKNTEPPHLNMCLVLG